jgi:hypothetical protein
MSFRRTDVSRTLILSLVLLLQASWAGGKPVWVRLQAAPYRGLNTVLSVQAGFSTPAAHVTIRLLRLDGAGPAREAGVYRVEEGQPVGGSLLRDSDSSPQHLSAQTVELLPLGTYLAEVSDGDGTVRSNSVNTQDFPLRLVRQEKDQEEKSFFQTVSGMSYAFKKEDELLAGRLIAPLVLSAPSGMVDTKDLRFLWKSGKAKIQDSVLYVFDEREVLWSASGASGLLYAGRRLNPGQTYYWVVGGRSPGQLVVCDRLGKFVTRRR